jgi:4-diphosphocytidyl-2-C-methyl-D-erythritol kinase
VRKINTNSDDLHLEAPAKVNFILRVLSRREDGYHELETWMQKVSLCDMITLRVNADPGIQLICSQPEIPRGDKNLAWRAADLFFSRSRKGAGLGVSIFLDKKIPVSAGLGGGSSDAGTVLKGLNSYFANEFEAEELIEMGRFLGADVPFFVTDMNGVLATGIGEKMLAVPSVCNCTIILVNPGFFVATGWVFEKFALTRADKNSKLTGSRKLGPAELSFAAMENDLETVTAVRYPVISEIKNELKNLGADKALMSGSGPTVFGIFPESFENQKRKIESVVVQLRQKFGEKVFVVDPRNGV